MPYAPNIQYDTTSLANGIANAGQNLAQGFREHAINQAKDREAQGIVTGLLQTNPDILQGADDKTQKLLEKFKLGETGLKDNIFLAGWAATTEKGLQKKQEMQAQQLQLQQLQAQAAQQAQARQFLQQAQQAQGGATGPLNNEAFKRFTSPIAQDAVELSRASGSLPSQEVLARMQENRATNEARVASKGNPIVFQSEKELNAKYPSDKFDYNFAPMPDGRVVIPDGKISPRAPAPTNLGPGFEPDPVNGGIRPIKGSQAEMDRDAAKAAKIAALQMHLNRADVIINTIKDVIPQVNGLTSGFAGGLSKSVPGTPAYDVAKRIDTIKANVGIEQLQAMRDASKSGSSGFGQLAVKELDALQSSMGNLEVAQSKGQLLKSLSEVQDHYDRWKKAVSGIDPDAKPKSVAESILEKYGISPKK